MNLRAQIIRSYVHSLYGNKHETTHVLLRKLWLSALDVGTHRHVRVSLVLQFPPGVRTSPGREPFAGLFGILGWKIAAAGSRVAG